MPELQRQAVRAAFAAQLQNAPQNRTERNLGLLFSRGCPSYPENATTRGEDFAKFLENLAQLPAPAFYKTAYERWKAQIAGVVQWEGEVDGRLFIGLGTPHAIETSLSFSRPYGLPQIPGSAVKGITRAYAEQSSLPNDIRHALFGRGGEDDQSLDDAGYVTFHDAWWVPGSANNCPLAAEVVTVHHGEYYTSEGKTPATDFDSPNPNAQLATHGKFLFAIEGDPHWAGFAMRILKEALAFHGIGGKGSAGYGYFGTNTTTDSANQATRGVSSAEPVTQQGKVVWKNALVEFKKNSGDWIITKPGGIKAVTKNFSEDRLSGGQKKKLPRNELRLDVLVEQEGNSFKILQIGDHKLS